MLGWSAVAGIVDWSIVTPMYFGGIAWGIMYDLIYAHQVGFFFFLFFLFCPSPYLFPSPSLPYVSPALHLLVFRIHIFVILQAAVDRGSKE
jgi:hypothetical protein